MIALVDTNVVLDVMLDRRPFATDSAAVLAAVETSRCQGFLCAAPLTTVHYIARRQLGTRQSLARISDLPAIFEIAPVNRAAIESALRSNITDFGDAVLHEAASQVGTDCIVTRNVNDFAKATTLIYHPAQMLEALAGA